MISNNILIDTFLYYSNDKLLDGKENIMNISDKQCGTTRKLYYMYQKDKESSNIKDVIEYIVKEYNKDIISLFDSK